MPLLSILRTAHIHGKKTLLTINITVSEIDEDTATTFRAKTMRLYFLSKGIGFHFAVTTILEDDIFSPGVDQEVAYDSECEQRECGEILRRLVHHSLCKWSSCSD